MTMNKVPVDIVNELQPVCHKKVGHYKIWTLDSGLDSGLDHGLDSGLNNGLNNWTKISIAKGKCHLHINQQQSFCL